MRRTGKKEVDYGDVRCRRVFEACVLVNRLSIDRVRERRVGGQESEGDAVTQVGLHSLMHERVLINLRVKQLGRS